MIAPCGMNCAICSGHLREKKKCPGCHGLDENKPNHCVKCIIKNCEVLKDSDVKFCYVCSKYPCRRLKQLDKRYKAKYNMSMIENLQYIKHHGLERFVENEIVRWRCYDCGALICVHNKKCTECGQILLDSNVMTIQ